MAKKLSMLLAAVAVVAFAVPAAASANTPTLFDAGGKILPGAKIEGVSTNAITTTSLGALKCATVTVTGEVTANSAGTVKGKGLGAGTSSTCEIGTVPPKNITITDITLTELHTATAGKGTINVTFKADIPTAGGGTLECHFTSAGVPFTYTVGAGNDVLSIANGDLTATPAACEPGLLHASFTLTTDVSPFAPVWIQ